MPRSRPARPGPYTWSGPEVPKPGGEQIAGEPPSVTRTEDVERTLELARAAFRARGLAGRAWERTIGVVVQPGVEFGDSTIFDYDREKARPASRPTSGRTGSSSTRRTRPITRSPRA